MKFSDVQTAALQALLGQQGMSQAEMNLQQGLQQQNQFNWLLGNHGLGYYPQQLGVQTPLAPARCSYCGVRPPKALQSRCDSCGAPL